MYRTLRSARAGIIAAMVSVAACAPVDLEASPTDASFDDGTETIPKYSVLNTLQYSILPQYVSAAKAQGSSQIRYPICVAAEFSITDADRQKHLLIEQEAINTWNQSLVGQTGWPVDKITLYMVGNANPSSCPSTDNELKVYKLVGLANQDRGYAEFYTFKNAVGHSEWTRGDVKRELHEYGHQLGLGDTYTEAGYEIPIGQPPGVMNLYYNVQTLTEDDIAAVRQIWYMINTKKTNPCATGYTTGATKLNNNGHRFCVKTNGKPPVTPPVDDGTPPGQCTNNNTHCGSWAAQGECKTNPGFMGTNCCSSCKTGTTTPTCRDSNTSCSSWAKSGECSRNPSYMRTSCCASCKGR